MGEDPQEGTQEVREKIMIEEKLKAAANILRQLGLDIPAGA